MRCGEGGVRCCAALGPLRRGGCACVSAPKSTRVCEEREGGEGRAEEGGSGHFYPNPLLMVETSRKVQAAYINDNTI